MQEIKLCEQEKNLMGKNWIDKRWPPRIFHGENGQLVHPYTRTQSPNLELMNCYYRYKSHHTFGCDAKVQMREKSDKPGLDECLVSGDHSKLCKQKNGNKPANYSSRTGTIEAKI